MLPSARLGCLTCAKLAVRSPMKLFRYRRPSLKTILGLTKAKKRIKKDLGITALLKPLRWWSNEKRRIKREVGYESEVGRLVRDGLAARCSPKMAHERGPHRSARMASTHLTFVGKYAHDRC